MLEVFRFILSTARREASLMFSLKTLGLVAIPAVWKLIANWFELQSANPSVFSTFLATGLLVSISLLYVIAKSAKPNFKLSLPNDGLSKTPVTSGYKQGMGHYVRFCVEADSDVGVDKCSASIIDIKKRFLHENSFRDTGFTDPVALEWSHSGSSKIIDLNPLEPRYIAIASANSINNKLRLETTQLPFKYEGLLDDIGTYRFVVRVTGERVSKIIVIDVDWLGEWELVKVTEGEQR